MSTLFVMIFQNLFFTMLSVLWLIGSSLALGYIISRRDKRQGPLLLYLWSIIFSWIFIGWLIGENTVLLYQAIYKRKIDRSA